LGAAAEVPAVTMTPTRAREATSTLNSLFINSLFMYFEPPCVGKSGFVTGLFV
jgi:hypothetical protein